MPHTIHPQNPIPGRHLELVNAAANFWNLRPKTIFHQTFRELFPALNASIALIQKEKRGGRGFDPEMTGAGGAAIGSSGALDGRSVTLRLALAESPVFVDVLNSFNALGIFQIPHASQDGMITSPCGGGPFYGTAPAAHQHQVMSLPATLAFFKELGFVIEIDTGYFQEHGPVMNGLPQNVWDAICQL